MGRLYPEHGWQSTYLLRGSIVRSFIAALRSLVLPYGTTSGQRIVLDGVNGRIDVYDINNDLLIRIDPDGIKVYDGNGELRLWFGIPTGSFNYSAFELYTARTDEVYPSLFSAYDVGNRNRLVITPGDQGRGSIEWSALPEDAAGTLASLLQAVCFTLDDPSNLRPIIDLTGASSRAGNEPRTVVSDLWYGTPNTFATAPTQIGSYGRGTLKLGTNANDVVVPTTTGTPITLVGAGAVPVYVGRRYRVLFGGGHSFLTAGSGFAVGDAAEFFLERDAGSGYAELPGPVPARVRIRANVAIAARWAMPVLLGYYEPGANATVDFRARVERQSGASTVAMTAGTNSGGSSFTLAIDDIGNA